MGGSGRKSDKSVLNGKKKNAKMHKRLRKSKLRRDWTGRGAAGAAAEESAKIESSRVQGREPFTPRPSNPVSYFVLRLLIKYCLGGVCHKAAESHGKAAAELFKKSDHL